MEGQESTEFSTIEVNSVDDLLTGILIRYSMIPNLTYVVANNYECKLDLWLPEWPGEKIPVLIYLHGGGWISGEREQFALIFLPFIEMGFAVANVQYRMAHVSPAPSAIQDCRAALRWVIFNSDKYGFDTDRIIVFGHSAGGHLALMTGMLQASAGFDWEVPGSNDQERQEMIWRWYAAKEAGKEELDVAAIIEWSGVTDVSDLLEGPNKKGYALAWLGTTPNVRELARQVSPINYVRPGLPPILLIHGDADTIVPYSHAVRLHEALDRAGVRNGLVTIPGGAHVRFKRDEIAKVYAYVRVLLERNGLMPAKAPIQ